MQEYNKFENKISVFITLLKQATKIQAEHIVTLSKKHQELWASQKELRSENRELSTEELELDQQWNTFLEQCTVFENQMKVAKNYFQEHIKLSNVELGSFSNMWGSYIEQLAVLHFMNVLRTELEVDTYMQKLKRYWGKNRNVEVDILATNKDTAFLIEVKNQLKPEHIKQILTTCDKIEEFFPELNKFKLQPIIMCINCDDEVIEEYKNKTIWVMQYIENTDNNVKPDWVWRYKENLVYNL